MYMGQWLKYLCLWKTTQWRIYADECLREVEKVYKHDIHVQELEESNFSTIMLDLIFQIRREVIEDILFETMERPLYSPDLSHCDFWLFPELKDTCEDGYFIPYKS
ncbi:hypothetical protein LOD99_15523 [Oopsacas minuta]|uniref:Uncharacterized protein n=1 Tax=Oopsacas minuta TaxID=111878 RepID=A0AAV7KCB8_9METZ|nr:hypothetical protein LOD99_15523 [Oopsacas minuta]